jgi:hypothetical protein
MKKKIGTQYAKKVHMTALTQWLEFLSAGTKK